jgi:hypothetical protein
VNINTRTVTLLAHNSCGSSCIMAHGQMEGIHLFFILFLNSLTMNYIKFELCHLPRSVIMLKYKRNLQNFVPRCNNPWVSGLQHRFHQMTSAFTHARSDRALGSALEIFFRASEKPVVFFKEKNPQSSVELLATRSFRAGGLLVVSLGEEKSLEHVY